MEPLNIEIERPQKRTKNFVPTTFNTPVSRKNTIEYGDLIIISTSNTEFKPFQVLPDTFFQCKKGLFHSSDMVGKKFGDRLFDEVAYKKKLVSKNQKRKDKFRRELNDKIRSQEKKFLEKMERIEKKKQENVSQSGDQMNTNSNGIEGENNIADFNQNNDINNQQNTFDKYKLRFVPKIEQTAEPEPVEISKTMCEIILLSPSAPLWTRSLRHRTQIIYDTDISTILFKLRIHNGSRVVEAGTGSGSLTHSIIQAIMPKGHVYTFEFHEERMLSAQQELREHGFEPDFVTCTHADVYKDGFKSIPDASIDAVFLDLPAPWLCAQEVDRVLKVGGKICTFSPCIEQVQKALSKLHQLRYQDVETMEVLKRGFFFRKHICDNRSVEYLESESEIKGHTAYLSFARKGEKLI